MSEVVQNPYLKLLENKGEKTSDGETSPLDEPLPAPLPVPDQPPSTVNPYLRLLEVEREARVSGLQEASARASQHDPAQFAKVMELSEKAKLPPKIVADHLQEVEAEVRRRDFDPDTFARTNPRVAQWLTADPANAPQAWPDVERLGKFERLVGKWGWNPMVKHGWVPMPIPGVDPTGLGSLFMQTQPGVLNRAWAAGDAQVETGRIGWEQMWGRATDEEIARADELERTVLKEEYTTRSLIERPLVEAAKLLPNTIEGMKEGGVGSAAGGAVGAAGGWLVGGPPGAAVGARYGIKFGGLAGATRFSVQIEGGGAYREYIGYKDENGKPLDRDVARSAALLTGVLAGGAETLSDFVLIKNMPFLDKLAPGLFRKQARQLLMRPTFRQGLKRAAMKYAENVGTESITEYLQELVMLWQGEVAKKESGQPFRMKTGQEMREQAMEAAEAAFLGSLVIGFPGPAGSFVRDTWRAAEAEAAEPRMRELAASLEGSVLAENAPAKLREAVAAVSEDGVVPSSVSISGDAVVRMFQSAEVDPRAGAEELLGPGGAVALDQAVKTGGFVNIPWADYVTKVVSKPELLDQTIQDTKFESNGMTPREAKAFNDKYEKQLVELEKQLSETAGGEIAAKVQAEEDQEAAGQAPPTKVEDTGGEQGGEAAEGAVASPMAQVYQKVLRGLKDAGWPTRVARIKAFVLARSLEARATSLSRDGKTVTATQLWEKYPIDFGRYDDATASTGAMITQPSRPRRTMPTASRWTAAAEPIATIPGEPSWFLDSPEDLMAAPVAVIETETPKGLRYMAVTQDGTVIDEDLETLEQAKIAAEDWADRDKFTQEYGKLFGAAAYGRRAIFYVQVPGDPNAQFIEDRDYGFIGPFQSFEEAESWLVMNPTAGASVVQLLDEPERRQRRQFQGALLPFPADKLPYEKRHDIDEEAAREQNMGVPGAFYNRERWIAARARWIWEEDSYGLDIYTAREIRDGIRKAQAQAADEWELFGGGHPYFWSGITAEIPPSQRQRDMVRVWQDAVAGKRPKAPAVFLGVQRRADGSVAFRLYNLTEDIPGHGAGSTVSDRTLLAAGFALPDDPKAHGTRLYQDMSPEERALTDSTRSAKALVERFKWTKPEQAREYLTNPENVGDDLILIGAAAKLLPASSKREWTRKEMVAAVTRVYSEAERVGRLMDSRGAHAVGVVRAPRRRVQDVTLTPEEKATIEAAATKAGINPQGAMRAWRRLLRQYPVSDGWARLEFNRFVQDPDSKTWVPEPKKIPWLSPIITRDPDVNTRRIGVLARRVEGIARELQRKAEAGDRIAITQVRQLDWYKEVQRELRLRFGGLGELFADLLGATSPRSNVEVNFQYAVEALELATSGAFDDKIDLILAWDANLRLAEEQFESYVRAHMDLGYTRKSAMATPDGKRLERTLNEARKVPEEILPKRANGRSFGINNRNVAMAIAGLWRELTPGKSPKARNFSANLTGRSVTATIDSWAARSIRRLAHSIWGGLPRIPQPAEGGVRGQYGVDLEIRGEFGYAQAVFERAAEALRTSGIRVFKGIEPADLQAMIWFYEKELWVANNWGREEGGSITLELARQGAQRYVGGFTIASQALVPSDMALATTAEELRQAASGAGLLAFKAPTSIGRYFGQDERTLDLEVVAESSYDPTPLLAAMVEKGKASGQESVILARLLEQDEVNANARPGIEVYFRNPAALEEIGPLLEKLNSAGLLHFTFIVDPTRTVKARGGAMPNVLGVRYMVVPEYDPETFDGLDDDALQNALLDAGANLAQVVDALGGEQAILSANVNWYDAQVVWSEEYDGVLEAVRQRDDEGAAPQGQRAVWPNASVREAVGKAARRGDYNGDFTKMDWSRGSPKQTGAKEARERAREVIDNLKPAKPEALTTLSGKVETGSGAELIASAIRRDYDKKGYVDLRGRSARTHQEVATMLRIYRDPRVETDRVIWVKDGKVIAHEAVTMDHPMRCSTVLPHHRDGLHFVDEFKDRMRRIGADGFYTAHNHPSGDPTPSVQDLRASLNTLLHLPGWLGEVVIDHNTYSVIRPSTKAEWNTLDQLELANQELLDVSRDKPLLIPYDRGLTVQAILPMKLPAKQRAMADPTRTQKGDPLWHSALEWDFSGGGYSPARLAGLVRGVTSDSPLSSRQVAIVAISGSGTINTIEYVPKGLVLRGAEFLNFLNGMRSRSGSEDFMAYVERRPEDNLDEIRELAGALVYAFERGGLRDAIFDDVTDTLQLQAILEQPGAQARVHPGVEFGRVITPRSLQRKTRRLFQSHLANVRDREASALYPEGSPGYLQLAPPEEPSKKDTEPGSAPEQIRRARSKAGMALYYKGVPISEALANRQLDKGEREVLEIFQRVISRHRATADRVAYPIPWALDMIIERTREEIDSAEEGVDRADQAYVYPLSNGTFDLRVPLPDGGAYGVKTYATLAEAEQALEDGDAVKAAEEELLDLQHRLEWLEGLKASGDLKLEYFPAGKDEGELTWRAYQGMPARRRLPTGTQAFKKWFGKSKVVDRKGKPQVVYFGGVYPIERFAKDRMGTVFTWDGPVKRRRHGIFTAVDPNLAVTYAYKPPSEDDWQGGMPDIKGQQLTPLYLSIENPLDFTEDPPEELIDALEELGEHAMAKMVAKYAGTELAEKAWELFDEGGPFPDWDPGDFIRVLQRLGYDGAKLTEQEAVSGLPYEMASLIESPISWVAFEPTQLKSAIANVGTYDPEDSSILHQTDQEQFRGRYLMLKEAFREWFADSKVVDEDGVPLTVYHVTDAQEEIRQFRGTPHEAHFTPDAPTAAGIAREKGRWERGGVRTMPVYLRITNPLRLRDLTNWDPTDIVRELLHQGVIELKHADRIFGRFAREADQSAAGQSAIVHEELEALGYDGIVYLNRWEMSGLDSEKRQERLGNAGLSTFLMFHSEVSDERWLEVFPEARDSYMVWRPEQIKSATGNRGTFSPNAASIAMQGPRGFLDIPGEGGRFNMGFLPGANLSTFFHEMGHYHLELLARLAEEEGAPDQIKADWAEVMKWLGVSSRDELTTEHHEKWARGIEAYFMEGKAPTEELQPVFERIKQWFVQTYESIVALGVELTPEVRGVMDRMLAAEQSVSAAEEDAALNPMWESAAEAGMTPEDWQKYQTAIEDSKRGARARVQRELLARLQRERDEEIRNARADAADRINEELDKQPVWQAIQLLRTGTLPASMEMPEPLKPLATDRKLKIDTQSMRNLFGPEEAKRIMRQMPFMWARDGGLHPDTVAAAFGFSSGDDLVQAMLNAGNRAQVVRDRVEAEILEKYPDPMVDGTLVHEAEAAVMEDQNRVRQLHYELKSLTSKSGGKNPPMDLARLRARASAAMAGKKVRDLIPHRYLRQASALGEAALKAAAGGKFDEAMVLKQQQILNMLLYREARDAKDRAEKAAEYLKRMAGTKARARLGKAGQVYLDAVDKLLENFEFKAVPLARLDERQSLAEFIAAEQAEGRDPVVPSWFLKESSKRNWKDLELGLLESLRDSVDSIAHQAILKNKLVSKRKGIDFKEGVNQLVAAIATNIGGEVTMPVDPLTRAKDEIAMDWLRARDASLLKIEETIRRLDGGDVNGPWHQLIWRPIVEAENAANELHLQFTMKLAQAFQKLPAERRQRLLEKRHFDFLGQGARGDMTIHAILAMAMNTGNDGNYKKLVEGRPRGAKVWGPEQVEKILATLDSQDWEFVQQVWDTLEELWPQIEELERRLTGLPPKKVEAKPMTRTGIDGKEVRLRGGYYPVVYRRETAPGQKSTQALASTLFEIGRTRAMTPHSHVEERTDVVAPILLDLDVIPRHLTQVIHDLTHREAVISVFKLVSAPEVQEALAASLGEAKAEEFKNWVRYIANSSIPRNGEERLLATLRRNVTTMALGLKATVTFQNLANYLNAAEAIGMKDLMVHVQGYMRHPGIVTELVYSKSKQMKHRANQLDRDVASMIRRVSMKTREKVADDVRVFAQIGAQTTDRWVAIPTWMAAYHQFLEKYDGPVTDPKELEQLAIEHADGIVSKHLGMQGHKDLTSVQRGSEAMKWMTQFYGWFSLTYSRFSALYYDARTGSGDARAARYHVARILARMWWMWIGPALLSELFSGRGPDEEKDQGWFSWSMWKVLSYPFLTLPVVRDLVGLLERGQEPRYGSPAALVTETGRAVSTAADVLQGEKEPGALVRPATRAVGYGLGLPLTQPMITGEYLYDLATGEEVPAGPADFAHDLFFVRRDKR